MQARLALQNCKGRLEVIEGRLEVIPPRGRLLPCVDVFECCVFYCHLRKNLLWAKLRDYAISRVNPNPRQVFFVRVVKM